MGLGVALSLSQGGLCRAQKVAGGERKQTPGHGEAQNDVVEGVTDRATAKLSFLYGACKGGWEEGEAGKEVDAIGDLLQCLGGSV